MWQIENTPLVKWIFAAVLLFLVIERIENTFSNKGRMLKGIKIFHRGFFYVLLTVYLAIIAVSSYSFFTAGEIDLPVTAAGAVIFAAGALCRRAAIRTLSSFWSVFIEVKEGQKIVREGIYRYLKHPYYTAVVIELIGFSLICNSFWGVFLTLTLQIPLLLVRIYYENRILCVFGRRFKFN